MMINENLSGYILAGGKSSRMGADKAFLEMGGETFLTRAVNTLQTVCGNRVKIVLNRNQTDFIEKLPANVPHIFDVDENRGAPGAIYAALQNCETKYAAILAVDLPFVTGEMIEKLAEIAQSSNKFLAVVPRQTDGTTQPLCAVYHVKYCRSSLKRLPGENPNISVRDFLDSISTRYVDESKLSDDAKMLFNVNYPADFQQLG